MGTKEKLEDSVIIIDKPPGLTSHETTVFVKRITGSSRSGHAGTLDPEVSGVLPVALGRATKLLRYIAGKDKTYVGLMKFRNPQTRAAIEGLFQRFTGELVQTPPKMSAVRKAPRKRRVFYLKLLEVQGRLALFETKVDAGTYIRTLCEDMGKECGGARMEELRRTAVGAITEAEASTMYDLLDAMWLSGQGKDDMLGRMLRPPETLIGLPKVLIKESALGSILTGAQVMVPALEDAGNARKGERVAVYCAGRFVGIGLMQASAEELRGRDRGMAVRMERVHLHR